MDGYKVTNLAGTPSDYSDKSNWVYLPEKADKEVDTFFLYPTVYFNPEPDAPQIVPIDDKMMRAGVMAHFHEAPQAFIDLTNLYEPYYRQSNIFALVGRGPEGCMAFQQQEQRTDIYAAFDYYFEHYNQGRPFILAGHSQGSLMVKIALRDYFKEHTDYLKRMVAAYIIGYCVTKEDLEANPALKFAEGADDTGVIISWNTETPENKNVESAIVQKNAISINPLNWKRDDTYAAASENLGDRLPINDGTELIPTRFEESHPGHGDAQLDLERGVVVCTTMTGVKASLDVPGLENPFGPGSLHCLDYPLYWENIRENIRTRIKAYFNR